MVKYVTAFDGTNDNLKLPANDSDFQFGSGDFTIETWFNPNNTKPYGYLSR